MLLPMLLVAAVSQTPDGYASRHTDVAAELLLAPDAPAWEEAAAAVWGHAPYRTRFRALWSEAGLHLRFDSEDELPWFTMTARDDRLWEEEVVEIFLDPERDGRYIEVELNPANVVCDLRRLGPGETATDPIGPMDRGFAVAGMRTAVASSDDSADWPSDWTAGWTGALFLPWSGLGLPAAPATGSEFAFNVFRIKRPGGPEAPDEGAVFAAWSPTGSPSFHVPEAFRPLRLVR